MKRKSISLREALLAAMTLSTVPALPAAADTAEDSMDNSALDDIIITAQKREQNLQDVPIVVTAVSDQLLQDTGVRDIKDLAILVPGLIVTSSISEGSTTARIRGIGTQGDNPGLESSVGVVIDGVYRPRNGVGFGDLGEVERIEVLKGPQGTLFGKNTSAGVINVITRKPTREFSAVAEIGGGNFNASDASASINGPISEKIAGRLFVSNRQRDGFYDVSTGAGPRTLDEDDNRDSTTARGQLLFSGSDLFSARLSLDYARRNESCCAAVQTNTGPTAFVVRGLASDGGLAIPADPDKRRAFENRKNTQKITDGGATLELDWKFEKLQLKSITGGREWENEGGQDIDYTSTDLLYRNTNGDDNFTKFRTFTQELQLNGESDRMNWVVGAFFSREKLDNASQILFGSDFEAFVSNRFAPSNLTGADRTNFLANQLGVAPGGVFIPGTGQMDKFEQDSTSAALYANDSIKITDSIELTLGGRYTQEQKDLDSDYNNIVGGAGCAAVRQNLGALAMQLGANQPPNDAVTALGTTCAIPFDPAFTNLSTQQDSVDEKQFTGTAKLAWRLNPQLLTYASYARGYKAGGYQLDRSRMTPLAPSAVLDTSFDRELVNSYELGFKSNLFTNTLLFNATGFYQDFKDFQTNTFTGVQFVVASIPQVVSQGVDADIIWQTPLPQLSLQGGFTYAKTEIEDFGTLLSQAGLFSPARKNDRLAFAPERSASLSATFEQPVGSYLLLRANAGAKYLSEYNTGSNLDPAKIQGSYTLVNARIGIGSIDDKWTVEVFSQNLTDKTYAQVIIDPAVQTGTNAAYLGAPRTFGITGRWKF
jgi:outer membrane receptor protein involved in Fe transport